MKKPTWLLEGQIELLKKKIESLKKDYEYHLEEYMDLRRNMFENKNDITGFILFSSETQEIFWRLKNQLEKINKDFITSLENLKNGEH